ncbi:MAG TPA: tRNA lysidine(34) synthetase TilS [Phnomibacter sp.]|nr:tRNA lysidine(34) synthetase TilS [Phnomibacter sp.]
MFESLHIKFIDHNKVRSLFTKGDLVVVGISGGMDSVVLTHLLKVCGQTIVLAHCNFNLRGPESLRDEQFVRTLAAQWDIPLFVESYDTGTYAHHHKLSIQVAARRLRYDFFERLRLQLVKPGQRGLIATAHHANDSVETMLINLFRGTGIDGLTGISSKNGHIIRPLLFATRAQIENYAQVNELSWVEDSSNDKEDYARNFIRHSILPAVAAHYPAVIGNMLGTAQKMRDAAGLYHQQVALELKRLVEYRDGAEQVPVLKLKKAPYHATLTWEWIKEKGFTEAQLKEVLKLMDADTGSYVRSASHRILHNRGWLVLAPLAEVPQQLVIIDQLPATIAFAGGRQLLVDGAAAYDAAAGIGKLPSNEARVDAGKVQLPLILRPWKQGDYFYPLGMAKKKKLARFLIDTKRSTLEKEQVWVLESGKRIIWVIGHRIDDRFKLTDNTREALTLKVV